MPERPAIKLLDCIWLRNAAADECHRAMNSERRCLERLGAHIEVLRSHQDREGLERLRRLLTKTDKHVLLEHLSADELKFLRPILQERRNFSIIADDWWSTPFWFNRHAEYTFYFTYNAFAVRLGGLPFARFGDTPLLQWPRKFNGFLLAMMGVRMASLALCPGLELWKWWQRQSASADPARMIFFPYAVFEQDLPLQETPLKYDFSNLGKTNVPWLMRDPFAPSYFAGANMYRDRLLINDAWLSAADAFRIYDWQSDGRWLSFDEYCQVVQQSRFTLATGGIHHNAIPKFIEFACLGTPMLGVMPPYDQPWLDQCLFPVDPRALTPQNIRAKLDEALALWPKLRENCQNLRQPLLKRYHLETVIQMAQDQIDGQPIPPGYVRKDFKAGA